MSSSGLPDNWTDLPDDKLGEELLTLWTHYQVSKISICPEDDSTDIAEELLNSTLLMDADVATDIPLEKALQKAASGDFAKAGVLLRDLLEDKAIVMVLEKWAQTGLLFRQNQAEKARKPRNRINIDGEKFSITSIVQELSLKTDDLGDFIPARDLWMELYSELDEMHLEPEEKKGLIRYS